MDSNCTSVAPSTEGRRLTLSIRILDERQKALPIKFLGCGKAGIVTKSREKVSQLNESFRLRAGRSRRVARDEWDPHDLLVDAVLAPLPAPSEVIPVITSENYERILELSFGSQVIEQPSDLSIEERNCRVITALSFALLSLGHFDRRLPKHGTCRQRGRVRRRRLKHELRWIMAIQILFHRVPRDVRRVKTNCRKKWFIRIALSIEKLNGTIDANRIFNRTWRISGTDEGNILAL